MWKRKVLAVLLLLLASFALTPASSAQAGPSCVGAGCVGRDPGQTSCASDAVNIAARVVPEGVIHLRWSKSCKLGWIRFTSSWRADLAGASSSSGVVYAETAAWPRYPGPIQKNGGIAYAWNGTSWWSRMVDARQGFCGKIRLNYQSGGIPGWGPQLCV